MVIIPIRCRRCGADIYGTDADREAHARACVGLSLSEILAAVHDHLTSTGALHVAHLVSYAMIQVARMEKIIATAEGN